jgi:predicted RND superfamily exporter protein
VEPAASHPNPALYRLGEWLIAHRRSVGLAAIAITAAMAWPALHVQMSTRFGDLLPYRHPFIAVHEKWANQFGGANNLTIMVEVREGTVFTRSALKKVWDITEALDRLPGINHDGIESVAHRSSRYLKMSGGVITMPPVMWGPPPTDWHVAQIRQIVHHAEHLHGILVSLDDKAALVRANFREGHIDYRRLFEEVNQRIVAPNADTNTTIWVAGEPRLYGWVYQHSGEIYWIFGIAVVLLWTMLYAYFHDWRGALRPTLTAVISTIWGLGAIRLIGFPLDPLAMVIPFFATARALSHSVQMHDRYYEEYHASGWNKERAILAAFADLFVPTLSGIATDALGMLVLVLVPIAMLQRIAIWSSIWVSSVVISELALNPIIYWYLQAPDRERVLARERGIFQRLLSAWSRIPVGPRARWVITVAWIAAFGLSAWQWRHLTVGDATAASPLLYEDSPYNEAHVRIQRFFGGVEPLIVVIEGQEAMVLHEPRIIETLEEFQRWVERDPNVGYSYSLADVVKATHMIFFDLQPRWGVIPIRRGPVASLYFFRFAGSSVSEIARFADQSFTNSHVTFFCRNHQGDAVARIIQRCREFIAAHPMEKAELRMAGGLIGVTAAANEEILKNDLLMNLLGFGTMFIAVLFTYRSFTAAALLMFPLFLANGIANAYQGYRNVGINLHTLPVITIGIGFGIDYGMYVTSRVIEELDHCRDLAAAVVRALETSGKAVTFTALSFAIATLTWTMSSIRFNAEMALLLFLWMTVSFVAAMTLLPALFVIVRPRFLALPARAAGSPEPAAPVAAAPAVGSAAGESDR